MEPAVCTYLEAISFHLTKQPLLVTIMSTLGVLESVVPIQHVAREGRARSLPVKFHHFPCSLFNHAAIFFSWVVLPERSTLQNEPNPSSFLFTSAGFNAVWSRIRRGKARYISVSIWSHIFTLLLQIPLYLHIATWFPVGGDPSPQTPYLTLLTPCNSRGFPSWILAPGLQERNWAKVVKTDTVMLTAADTDCTVPFPRNIPYIILFNLGNEPVG